jgi:hypothetical protein
MARKGMKQLVYNQVVKNISKEFPELFQVQELKVVPDKETGKITYPQLKDPNIIMAIINGKRVPVLVDKYVKNVIDDVLTYNDVHILEKIVLASGRLFTKGTTAAYAPFVLANIPMDTITATAQTETKMIPVVGPAKELLKSIMTKGSIEAQYYQEYSILVGDRQTLIGWQNMSGQELLEAVTKEREGILKVLDYVNKGADILAIPSTKSEIFTRAGEYIRSRKQGDSQVVAIEKAGRVTAPFHHTGRLGRGRLGKTFVKSIPFFNPALQVLDQTLRTGETAKGRQKQAFVMLVIAALMSAGTASVVILGSDKQKRMLADLSPEEMGMYIHYPSKDGESLPKMRVPDNYSWFAGFVNMLILDKTLNTNYTAGEYADGITAFLPDQLMPWHPTTWFWSLVPHALKQPALISAGKKDFPKIMDLESQGMQNLEPRLRYTDRTSIVAKWLGDKFNYSPIKIDAIMTGLFGRASGFITGKPSAYDIRTKLKREEYFDSGRTMQIYYEAKKRNEQLVKTINNQLRELTPEEQIEQLVLEQSLGIIDDLIKQYGKIDDKENPDLAEEFKRQIYQAINEELISK